MAFLVILALTLLNRASGDDRWQRKWWTSKIDPLTGLKDKWLPSRPLPYTSLSVALISALLLPWKVAGAVGLAYFVWRAPAWGHLFGLGRYRPTDREPSFVEATCLVVGNPHGAFFLRQLFCVPGLGLVSWVSGDLFWVVAAPGLAVAITAAYELAWRLRPQEPIIAAELGTGALWGLLIAAGA